MTPKRKPLSALARLTASHMRLLKLLRGQIKELGELRKVILDMQPPKEFEVPPRSDRDDLLKAEHQARCDLIDALFYVEILFGMYGDYVTEGEKVVANEFWRKMRAKYPQQKGAWGKGVIEVQREFARTCAEHIVPPPNDWPRL